MFKGIEVITVVTQGFWRISWLKIGGRDRHLSLHLGQEEGELTGRGPGPLRRTGVLLPSQGLLRGGGTEMGGKSRLETLLRGTTGASSSSSNWSSETVWAVLSRGLLSAALNRMEWCAAQGIILFPSMDMRIVNPHYKLAKDQGFC